MTVLRSADMVKVVCPGCRRRCAALCFVLLQHMTEPNGTEECAWSGMSARVHPIPWAEQQPWSRAAFLGWRARNQIIDNALVLSTPNAPTCTTGKVLFLSELEAEKAAVRVTKKSLHLIRPEGRGWARAYRCKHCDGWHITSCETTFRRR